LQIGGVLVVRVVGVIGVVGGLVPQSVPVHLVFESVVLAVEVSIVVVVVVSINSQFGDTPEKPAGHLQSGYSPTLPGLQINIQFGGTPIMSGGHT
jgi:hypothetical protein